MTRPAAGLSALLLASAALAACTINGTVETDRDMVVTGPEAAAEPEPIGHGKPAFLAAYDLDGDGVVPRGEFDAARRAGFDARDTDASGLITEDEYVAEFEARNVGRETPDLQRQIRQTRERFHILDDDGDGVMSWEEFSDSGDFVFTSLDSNGDGVVDEADDAEAY